MLIGLPVEERPDLLQVEPAARDRRRRPPGSVRVPLPEWMQASQSELLSSPERRGEIAFEADIFANNNVASSRQTGADGVEKPQGTRGTCRCRAPHPPVEIAIDTGY